MCVVAANHLMLASNAQVCTTCTWQRHSKPFIYACQMCRSHQRHIHLLQLQAACELFMHEATRPDASTERQQNKKCRLSILSWENRSRFSNSISCIAECQLIGGEKVWSDAQLSIFCCCCQSFVFDSLLDELITFICKTNWKMVCGHTFKSLFFWLNLVATHERPRGCITVRQHRPFVTNIVWKYSLNNNNKKSSPRRDASFALNTYSRAPMVCSMLMSEQRALPCSPDEYTQINELL